MITKSGSRAVTTVVRDYRNRPRRSIDARPDADPSDGPALRSRARRGSTINAQAE
jgi:hypothetical protein